MFIGRGTKVLAAVGSVLLAWGSVLADDCADVAVNLHNGEVYCELENGADAASLSDYSCTSTSHNAQTEDFEDVKVVDKKWDTGDVNCSCFTAGVTYEESKTHTNTNSFSVNGSFEYSTTATVGADLAGVAKAEASSTATWTVGMDYGHEDTDEEGLTVSTAYTVQKCSEWHYNKWYYRGTVNGTADHRRYWSAAEGDGPCWNSMGYEEPATGTAIDEDAYAFYGHGLKNFDGSYAPHGQGFQPSDCRCTKCNTSTDCYNYDCEGDCGKCES